MDVFGCPQIEYTLRLSSSPLEDEEVRIGVLGAEGGQFSVRPEAVVFTAANWRQEQRVSLYVQQDYTAAPQVGPSFGSPWGSRLAPLET